MEWKTESTDHKKTEMEVQSRSENRNGGQAIRNLLERSIHGNWIPGPGIVRFFFFLRQVFTI
jgi:hypothetical protein